jgi:hypothetical protein
MSTLYVGVGLVGLLNQTGMIAKDATKVRPAASPSAGSGSYPDRATTQSQLGTIKKMTEPSGCHVIAGGHDGRPRRRSRSSHRRLRVAM